MVSAGVERNNNECKLSLENIIILIGWYKHGIWLDRRIYNICDKYYINPGVVKSSKHIEMTMNFP